MVSSLSCFLLCLSSQVITSISTPTQFPHVGNLSLPSHDGWQISNTSYAADVSDWVLLPYKFHVPNTGTYLHLGFGFRRRSLDPMAMGGLIAVVQDLIDRAIEEAGPQVVYPPTIAGWQYFHYDLGDGLILSVWNLQAGRYWTWGTFKNVVEGLRQYLIVGEKFRRTYFNFVYVSRLSSH